MNKGEIIADLSKQLSDANIVAKGQHDALLKKYHSLRVQYTSLIADHNNLVGILLSLGLDIQIIGKQNKVVDEDIEKEIRDEVVPHADVIAKDKK